MGLQKEADPIETEISGVTSSHQVILENANPVQRRLSEGERSRKARNGAARRKRPTAQAPTKPAGPLEVHLDWASRITDHEWELYLEAIKALRAAEVPFMLGGGFAQAAFTGRWRNTKDIDLYVMPDQREKAVEALTRAGFVDYYPTLAYDRNWISRSTKGEVLVDVIWGMANKRGVVDDLWLKRAGRIVMRGEELLVVPIEEFAWCKLYIVQRDRCDWIDVLNLFYCNGPGIDWAHLIERLGDDVPLLTGILTIYGWLHPERALRLSASLRRRLGLRRPKGEDAQKWRNRVGFLDSRAWFTALKPRGERLEI